MGSDSVKGQKSADLSDTQAGCPKPCKKRDLFWSWKLLQAICNVQSAADKFEENGAATDHESTCGGQRGRSRYHLFFFLLAFLTFYRFIWKASYL
jgi:hypothetical protein